MTEDGPAQVQRKLEELGWNQAELARRTGSHAAQISKILKRQRKPGLALALKLKDLLGVEPSVWVDGGEAA